MISVESNINQVRNQLNKIQRQQLPYAAAVALTRTAQDIQRAEAAQLPRKLDNPTPFTMRAFAIKTASKRNLQAEVFIKTAQAEYLQWAISGGRRQAARRGTGVPVGARLNKHGNIPGRRKGLVKGKKQFAGTINGVSGVWQRSGGKRNPGVQLMVAFERSVQYDKRFPFRQIAEGVARSRFSQHLAASVAKALATA